MSRSFLPTAPIFELKPNSVYVNYGIIRNHDGTQYYNFGHDYYFVYFMLDGWVYNVLIGDCKFNV